MNGPRVIHPSYNVAHWYAWQAFRASLEPCILADSIREANYTAWRDAVRELARVSNAQPFADDWHTRAEMYRLLLRVSTSN